MKEKILYAVDGLVSDFLYYDRKEDEELPRYAIQQAILDDIVTVDEIVERFKGKLVDGMV